MTMLNVDTGLTVQEFKDWGATCVTIDAIGVAFRWACKTNGLNDVKTLDGHVNVAYELYQSWVKAVRTVVNPDKVSEVMDRMIEGSNFHDALGVMKPSGEVEFPN